MISFKADEMAVSYNLPVLFNASKVAIPDSDLTIGVSIVDKYKIVDPFFLSG